MNKYQIAALFIVAFLSYRKANSQVLKPVELFEMHTNSKFGSLDFPTLGFRRKKTELGYEFYSIRNNKFFAKIPLSSIFEVFNDRFLVVSIKVMTPFSNGEPDFTKSRDSVYIIDLKRRGRHLREVYKAALGGRKIHSNAVELIKFNKGFNYDLAIQSISLSSKELVFLNFETMKEEKITLSVD